MTRVENNNNKQQTCGWKRLADEKGQRRMAKLVCADRTSDCDAGTQLTTLHDGVDLKSVSEPTPR